MANTKSKATKIATEAKLSSDEINEAKTDIPVTDVAPSDKATESKSKKEYRVKQNLDPNTIITVRNGYQGKLVYRSRKTNEKFEWESFGDEQDMDLQELKNARNASKVFFENNWFLIDDPEVLDYLGVSQFYRHALTADSFDDLFSMPADEVRNRIATLSSGQKKTVAYRAKQLIREKKIDSLSVITALEEGLSIELIER